MENSIIGVGFLLFVLKNGTPSLFTIKELKDKPQYYKKAGMLSFPLETFEPGDVNSHGTTVRLFSEEMGIPGEQVAILRLVSQKFNLIPGRKDVCTSYGYGIFLGDPKQAFIPKDKDIIFVGWKTIPDLLGSFIRIEVAPILNHLLSNGFYNELFDELINS